MNYIKDTDFLPDVRNVSQDVYRLTYGIAKIRNEKRIYDIIVYSCRAYLDTPLRRAKINAWKSALKDVADKLGLLSKTPDTVVCIPYFELVCTPEGLYNLYLFALGVLNELYSLEGIPKYREKSGKEAIQLFFPIANLADTMRAFGRKCKQANKFEEDIEDIIENELIKRGLSSASTKKTSADYDDLFFNEENSTQISNGETPSDAEEENELSWYDATGFLYLALNKYLSIAYDRALPKEKIFGTILDKATYRIAQGIFKHDEPINGEKAITSKNTFYSYVRKFKSEKVDSETRKVAEKRFNDFIK